MDNTQNTSAFGGIGYLVVRVSTANGAIPLERAQVTVRGEQEENSDIFVSMYTSSSGLTEKIELPAPSRALTENPGNSSPYGLYGIDVFYDGYKDSFFTNVPIFDTITSVQPVNMIPRPDNEYPDNFAPRDNVVVEGENPDL